ncbi:L,D-peptidoglycan transpeptidase YkuD, ErfK/YbiS/YcfS/YnhG family [Selenomonas ruminantium]|uniref:L,D-peptidoglycan transpeptidase YkuD, ErfK/YbiS/YcfS/YnhG family n=1 Tax=Selenomonas ruminantium TaxID=971 RepID=A0A1M6V8B3_SELRU|nr:L,D-transpeptidase family protein [Selenomonas ruminantium]SHK77730.1 L,D-peptidoglycan transpeptidase YkuD, ErfK/YbiS/YcfS/YnhG family [Selenomonas ruminantium]
MRKWFLIMCLLLSCVFLNGMQAAEAALPDAPPKATPEWIQKLPAAKDAEQMFIVAGFDKTTAWVSMHEKNDKGKWEQLMTTPGFMGRNGLGKEREGDGKTPVGVFKFDAALGIAPDPGCAIPYIQVDENQYWSGDERPGMKYNQLVDIRQVPGLNKEASEHLVDYDPHYIYVLNMGYNADCVPGKGSALFLHCLDPRKPYTGGCVAIPKEKMLFVMQHVKPGCVVVIDSLENLGGTF